MAKTSKVRHRGVDIQVACPANSKIFQNLLFRDPTILPRLKLVLNSDLYNSTQIGATGLSPHVAVLKKINKLDIDVKNAITKHLRNMA